MRRAHTLIEMIVAISILAIIAGIIVVSFVERPQQATRAPQIGIISSNADVREWFDEKTGKRYLVFDRSNGGIFVIEAPLTVEKK